MLAETIKITTPHNTKNSIRKRERDHITHAHKKHTGFEFVVSILCITFFVYSLFISLSFSVFMTPAPLSASLLFSSGRKMIEDAKTGVFMVYMSLFCCICVKTEQAVRKKERELWCLVSNSKPRVCSCRIRTESPCAK